MPETPFPEVTDYESFVRVLNRELGHCTCGSDGTIPLLVRFLRLVNDRTDSLSDPDRYKEADKALTDFIESTGSPSLMCWFIYFLEKLDFVTHGFNIFDVTILEKGRNLVSAFERTGLHSALDG